MGPSLGRRPHSQLQRVTDGERETSTQTYTLTIAHTAGHESAGLEGDLNVTAANHRWVIRGAGSAGANRTVIDASGLQDRAFQIVTPGTQVVFQDLVLTGGLAQDDGTDGDLPGTTDARGGAILNNGGDVTLTDVVLTGNVARGGDGAAGNPRHAGGAGHSATGGGLFSSGGSPTVTDSFVANNQALGGSGGAGGTASRNDTAGRGGTGGNALGGGGWAPQAGPEKALATS